MDNTCWIKVEPIEEGGEEKSVANADGIGVDLGINYKEYHQTEITSNIVKEEVQHQAEEAKDVSARWKILHEKSVPEKTKDKSGSGAAKKPGNSNMVCARQTTNSLSDSINSFADVKEEAEIDAEESNSGSSVKPSPLPSANHPSYLSPISFPSPTPQRSNTINSSLPFPTPTSALFCIPTEPTTPQTTLEPATSVHSNQRNSMKVSNGRWKEEDLLAALIRNQPREMDECDLYCASLAARLRKMPAHDMHAIRFKIEKVLFEYSLKRNG